MFSFETGAASADSKVLRDHFVEHVLLGIDIQTALNYTFADATAAIAQRTIRGFKLVDSLAALGIPARAAAPIGVGIEKAGYVQGELSYATLRAAIASADVIVIPTAECIHKHLTKSPKLTREQIQKAWDECLKK